MRVNQTKFAEIIGKSGQYVALLVEQGLPAERNGKRGSAVFIDAPRAIAWLLERERQKARAEFADGGPTTEAETRRLRAAQADLAELEAAEKRGQLIDVEGVRQVIGAAAVVFSGQLDGLSGRVATELAGMHGEPARIRHKLRDETRRIRDAVSTEFARLAVEAHNQDEEKKQ